MTTTLTVQIKLLPTKEQAMILTAMSKRYIQTVNELVGEMVTAEKRLKKTSKDVFADLPSAVKNQAIKDAGSVFVKARKTKFEIIPKLKKPVCVWNNQNYRFNFHYIYVPLWINGKSKKVPIRALLVDKENRNFKLLNHKLGTLRITRKNHKWIAQIAVTVTTAQNVSERGNVLGVDLGLKVPAVAIDSQGRVRFFGNGRQNKYKKRQFRAMRKRLGKVKKVKVIRKLNNKEQRYMIDQDHKVSRAIVNFAQKTKATTIRLEQLTNIRQTTRTSRKNEKNLHTWSFYRLAQFIEYKAELAGIKVEYVNPAYTSQTCPSCGTKNKAKDRKYTCSCGFSTHRDIVGAMNIRYAPVIDGNSQSA